PQSRQYSWSTAAGAPQRTHRSGCLGTPLSGLLAGPLLDAGRRATACAEAGVAGKRVAALGTGDHRLLAGRTPALGGEVGAPRQRGAALATADGPPVPDGGEHLVELPEAGVEPEQLVAALRQQVLAEAVAAIHLQDQAAEVAEPLLAHLDDVAALPSDH